MVNKIKSLAAIFVFVYQNGMANKKRTRGPKLLSAWMQSRKITQAQAAKRLRISQGHVSMLVNGLKGPSLALARRISKTTAEFVAVGDWVAP